MLRLKHACIRSITKIFSTITFPRPFEILEKQFMLVIQCTVINFAVIFPAILNLLKYETLQKLQKQVEQNSHDLFQRAERVTSGCFGDNLFH